MGWEPTCTFRELIKEMVAADMASLTEAGNKETQKAQIGFR
jgi:hypothetical protein